MKRAAIPRQEATTIMYYDLTRLTPEKRQKLKTLPRMTLRKIIGIGKALANEQGEADRGKWEVRAEFLVRAAKELGRPIKWPAEPMPMGPLQYAQEADFSPADLKAVFDNYGTDCDEEGWLSGLCLLWTGPASPKPRKGRRKGSVGTDDSDAIRAIRERIAEARCAPETAIKWYLRETNAPSHSDAANIKRLSRKLKNNSER